MLLLARDLSGRIEAQDLSGRKDMEKLSEAEQEMLEEVEQSVPSYYDPEQAQRGKPVLLYVARLTDKEQASALQQAYARAKADAERLAEAAGRKLGALRRLHTGSANPYDQYGDIVRAYASAGRYQMMQILAEAQADDPQAKEAFGTEPGPIKYRVAVSVSFVLSN